MNITNTPVHTTSTPQLLISGDQLHDDILGNIFSFLLADVSSINSASLVCRTWALSTRRYVFESATIRPSGIQTLVEILTDHPWPTLISNVRRLAIHGVPDITYKGCSLLDSISCHLTHFTLQGAAVASFEHLVTMIHNMSQLQSIALLNITFPLVHLKNPQNAGLFLPSSVRRFRVRNTVVHPFLAWLSAHPDIPPLTHLDVGQLDDHEIHMADKVLFRVASSLRYIVVSFRNDVAGHSCHADKTMLASLCMPAITISPTPNSMRFQEVFGVPVCSILSLTQNLSVIHVEGFVGHYNALSSASNAAEFLAARVLASAPGTRVKRIILGLEVSSAAQLCQYNINWPFFDEMFTSDCYRSLEMVEFRHSGKGNLDNIADYVSTNLPLSSSKNLLSFCKEFPNLADIHII